MKGITRTYSTADAATLRRFHHDTAFVRLVRGPIGSGKSTACVNELFKRACLQQPNEVGVRRTRFGVVRQTYPELVSTTIPTWSEWLNVSVCPITYSAPITGRMKQPLGDGTTLDMEVFFIALNLPKDVKKLLSLELTGAWINEAREVDKTIVDAITGRVGRYPPKIDGTPITWSGVIMDTNPPDELHWWYKLAEETDPRDLEGWRFFAQPPALIEENGRYRINPYAENVKFQQLGEHYWIRQVAGKSKEWIKVYLMGQYGTISAGKPIYENSWLDDTHVANCVPIPGLELIIGWDFGLSPSICITQVTKDGRLLVLAEVIGENIGVESFASDFIIPYLSRKYPGFSTIHVGDPAGNQRAQTNERTVFDGLRRLGIKIRPAPTQDPLARWEAVRWFLSGLVGGKPRLRLDPGCKVLRKGFNGGYCFRRLQVAGAEKYSEAAEKNMFSHVHDALQYACAHIRQPYLKPESPPPPHIIRPYAHDSTVGY